VHTAVRRFIKTGIGFLVLGLLLGVFMLVRRELLSLWPHPYLVSAHVHALLVGFVMFMILGVALWLFPRADKADTRYQPGRIDAAYWILLAATGGRFLGEVLRAWYSEAWLAWLVVAGGVGQAVGIGLFFVTMWSRIRPVGSHVREAKGERF
jgi:cbb3-type cytochrome oxidase subunit 1